MTKKPLKTILVVSILINLLLLGVIFFRSSSPTCYNDINEKKKDMSGKDCLPPKLDAIHTRQEDTSQKPYIFIGGVPSSGTTLVRVVLDAHPDIRCGEETRLVPRILQMRERWRKAGREHKRLIAAGLNDTVINIIVRNFISNIIELHGPPAKYLCNKDPLALAQMQDLHKMFPKAKFLLVIRDGRAVANSIVSRNLTISGVDHKSYLSAALFWNKAIERMWMNCERLGPRFCLKVYFEKLVTNPKAEMTKVLKFLHIRWHDNVLHHEEFIGHGVSLSK